MSPGSFDAETAREIVGDSRARVIESEARADADAGVFKPLGQWSGAATYWAHVQAEMERVVYTAQHAKRLERIKRKATA